METTSIEKSDRKLKVTSAPGGSVYIELIERKFGDQADRRIVWSDFSRRELVAAEAYAMTPPQERDSGFQVSDTGKVVVSLMTLKADMDNGSVMVCFEQQNDVRADRIFATYNEEDVASFFRTAIEILRS